MSAPAMRPHLRLLACTLALAAWAAPVGAALPLRHLGQLAEQEQMATGLLDLSDQEAANLENLIAYEISSAQAGGVTGFAGTFSSRRSDDELAATGLGRLGDDQRERLDQHIAGMIADNAASVFVYNPNLGMGGADGATAADNAAEIARPPLIVRNEVSVTVGGSSAGGYYGGSVTTTLIDAKGRWAASVSISGGKGAAPYYYGRGPYRYGPWR